MASFSRDHPYILVSIAICLSSLILPTLGTSVASQAYTPVQVKCPTGSLVRSAPGLSPEEASYISTRKSSVLPSAWSSYLANVEAYSSSHAVTIPDYVHQLLGGGEVPDGMTVGMAVSGGGYRAAIVGGGIMNAFDGRNTSSVQAGTGGLLQGVSYMSGLSGGGWLVSALTQAGFPTFPDLAFGMESDNSAGETSTYGGFLAQYGFIDASSNLLREADYLANIVAEISGKKAAGFSVTMTDLWARVLARHFVSGTSNANFFKYDSKHGAGSLWSNAAKSSVLFSPESIFVISRDVCLYL